MISNEKEFSNYNEKMEKIINSFRRINDDLEIQNLNPPKIRIVSHSKKEKSLTDILQKNNIQPRFSEDFFELFNNIQNRKKDFPEKIKMFY